VNITLVHRLMEAMAADELLPHEQADIERILELWNDLADAVVFALHEGDAEKTDDLITITHYLTGLVAVYLLNLSS